MKMKKTLLFIPLLILLIALNSCEDSLGLDPSVKTTDETPIGEGGDPINVDNRFKPKVMEWHKLHELYDIKAMWPEVDYSDFDIIYQNILIDTTGTDTLYFIDFELKNNNPDRDYQFLNDKYTGIRINLDSINRRKRTMQSIDSNCHINMYDFLQEEEYTLGDSEFSIELSLDLIPGNPEYNYEPFFVGIIFISMRNQSFKKNLSHIQLSFYLQI